jgi:hypothetical protein
VVSRPIGVLDLLVNGDNLDLGGIATAIELPGESLSPVLD